jgi:hypothetical protein
VPHEVTVIKGWRFPTCRHCKGVSFELTYAAEHVLEIDHLEKPHARPDILMPLSWRAA